MQFQPKKGLTLRIKSFAFFLEKKYSDFTKERFLASKSIQYVMTKAREALNMRFVSYCLFW